MSGGAAEYVMGYTTLATTIGSSSGITALYPTFFDSGSDYEKYYDKYTSTVNTNYNNRILGDATGEMGPFFSSNDPDGNTRNKSSWYGDFARFATSSYSWLYRGGAWNGGTISGIFAFINYSGESNKTVSFRVVLTPQE